MGSNGPGMGNPHESRFYNQQFRDFGPCEPGQKDVVFDPTCDPMRMDPVRRREMDELCCTLKECFREYVFFTKKPSFVEPPFFSKPVLKVASKTVAKNSTVVLLQRRVEARQRAVVTAIGIDFDQPQVYGAHELVFWFTLGGHIYPLFDDQSGLITLQTGQTTIIPGSIEQPFSLRQNGLLFLIKGPTEFEFICQNTNLATDVKVSALMAYYEYEMKKAAEFETADVQL